MDYINEVLKKSDKTYLEKEIKERRELISTMVGTLYPRILEDEIYNIQEKIERMKKNSKVWFLTKK